MSQRQNTLYERMKSAKERFIKTKKALDTMLLNELHNNGVYTPDQLNKTYIAKNKSDKLIKKAKLSNQKARSSNNDMKNDRDDKTKSNDDQQSNSKSGSDNVPSLLP